MQIVVYAATDAPSGFEYVAHIVLPVPGKPGKPDVLGFLPVVFRASTPEAARQQAQKHWDDELEKARKKTAQYQATSERMKGRGEAAKAREAGE